MSHKRIQIRDVQSLSITGTSNFYSSTLNIAEVEGYSCQINHTGAANFSAVVVVQANNSESNTTSWVNVASETVSITGVTGSSIIDVFDHNYGFTRLQIQASAGSGQADIITLLRSRVE